jgi:hypothetical protein
MLFNEDREVISEDMKTLTISEESDDNVEESEVIDGIDLSSLPEELKPAVTKMMETLKAQSAKLEGLQMNKDQVEALLQMKGRDDSGQSNKTEVERLADKMQFEDGDYYKKFLSPMAEAIDKINDQISLLTNEVSTTQRTNFEGKVNSFFETNKVDKTIIKKMDEIATKYGKGLYNDLPKLLLFAKADLGIATKQNVTRMQPKREFMETSKVSRTVTEPVKVKSMEDAFKKAVKEYRED